MLLREKKDMYSSLEIGMTFGFIFGHRQSNAFKKRMTRKIHPIPYFIIESPPLDWSDV